MIDTIESPCVRNCCLDDKEICVGCFRSLTEICGWAASSNDEKREILKHCDARREERRLERARARNGL